MKELRVLNKVLRLTKEGLELEADPRHSELVVKALGLEGAKESHTPGVKHAGRRTQREEEEETDRQTRGQEEEDDGLLDADAEISVVDEWRDGEPDEEMTAEDARAYRSTVARLNYMASDRPDMKICCQGDSQVHVVPQTK